MHAIGETLRRERLRRNLDLQQISTELKLSTRFLEAIENEQFERLPGGVFTRSFVRQYARLLGLDEDEMAAEAARLAEPAADLTPAVETRTRPSVSGFPLPPAVSWDRVSDGLRTGWPDWLPALALVVVVVLACSGGYAWWQRAQRPAASAVKATAPLPQPTPATPAPDAAAPSQTAADAQPPEPAGSSVAPPTPQASPSAAPAAGAVAVQGAVPVSATPPSADSSAAEASGASFHVQLTAREPVWVRAVSNGKIILTVTMAANETRTVDAQGPVELRLGNAGGIDIELNGKPIGPVGPKGQVRSVQLTSGGFTIVAPSNPTPIDPL